MKRLAALLLLLSTTAFAQDAQLQHRLANIIRQHRGKVALYAKDLKSGKAIGIDAEKPVKTASVIKLPILYEAFQQAAVGKLSLDDRVVLMAGEGVAGSGVLQFMKPGLDMSLEDALTLMITLSDNTATNLAMDRVGIANVNATAKRMGMANTYLYKKVFKPAEGPMPADQKQFGLGKTSARDMGSLLENIEKCSLPDARLCERMLAILRNQQHRNMIPRYLETADTSEVTSSVANKTGSLDAVRNDVGIVYTRTGPIVISIFTYDNEDQSWTPDNAAELLVGKLAQAIVETWAPQGVKSAPETLPASLPGASTPAPGSSPPAMAPATPAAAPSRPKPSVPR